MSALGQALHRFRLRYVEGPESLRPLRLRQSRQLWQLLARTKALSPFYKEKFRREQVKLRHIRSVSDLPKLGFFTTPEDIQKDAKAFLCVPEREIYRVGATSGSLGPTKQVYFSKNDWQVILDNAVAGLRAGGATVDDVLHILYHVREDGSWMTSELLSEAGKCLGCEVIKAGDALPVEQQFELIRDRGSTILYGAPSYLYFLTRGLESTGADMRSSSVKTIRVGAEPLSDVVRAYLESSWGAQVFDNYGMSELGSRGAGECAAKGHLHICSLLITEVIDPETLEVLPRGQEGELVYTTLRRTAGPLLRYRSGDLGRLLPDPACTSVNYASDIMDPIKGRLDDLLIFGSGLKLYPAQFTNVLCKVEQVQGFQVVIEKRDALDVVRVRVETNTAPSEAFEEMLKSSVLDYAYGLRQLIEVSGIVAPLEIEYLEPGTLKKESPIKTRALVDRRN